MSGRDEYCWGFGEHKGDPCPCGWTSDRQKASEIRQFLKRQQDATTQAAQDTAALTVKARSPLQAHRLALEKMWEQDWLVEMVIECKQMKGEVK